MNRSGPGKIKEIFIVKLEIKLPLVLQNESNTFVKNTNTNRTTKMLCVNLFKDYFRMLLTYLSFCCKRKESTSKNGNLVLPV